MEVYLDNAATTKIIKPVIDIMVKVMEFNYGNPSSRHSKGIEAEVSLRFAKDMIAKSLKVSDKEIIFTSGGTEANNLALIGAAKANMRKGKRIITSTFEHPSVLNTMMYLQEEGFEIVYVPVDKNGRIKEDELIRQLNDDVILVSIMYVNNEIGTVQDIKKLSKIVKKHDKNIIFHVDAIQAFGKYKIRPKSEDIDLLSVSGHKFHGPKGVGFLYINDKIKIQPIIYGGGQQKGMRSGTENVASIIGMAEAVKECYNDFDKKVKHMYNVKTHLIEGLKQIDEVYIHGIFDELESLLTEKIKETAPHIINASFKGIKSEVLLNSLDNKEILVSSGSACAANHKNLSSSLIATGVDEELSDSAIRFSISCDTTIEEIDYTLEQLNEIVPLLRKYRKK